MALTRRQHGLTPHVVSSIEDILVPRPVAAGTVAADPRPFDQLLAAMRTVKAARFNAAERLERGLARDGAAMRGRWEDWMREEALHFARERTAERADVRLDGCGRMTR